MARPYICRLTNFKRLTWPSVCPLLHGLLRAAKTAARSRPRLRDKSAIGRTALASACARHCCSAAAASPVRARTRLTNRRAVCSPPGSVDRSYSKASARVRDRRVQRVAAFALGAAVREPKAERSWEIALPAPLLERNAWECSKRKAGRMLGLPFAVSLFRAFNPLHGPGANKGPCRNGDHYPLALSFRSLAVCCVIVQQVQ